MKMQVCAAALCSHANTGCFCFVKCAYFFFSLFAALHCPESGQTSVAEVGGMAERGLPASSHQHICHLLFKELHAVCSG